MVTHFLLVVPLPLTGLAPVSDDGENNPSGTPRAKALSWPKERPLLNEDSRGEIRHHEYHPHPEGHRQGPARQGVLLHRAGLLPAGPLAQLLAAAARRHNPAAVNTIPLEYIDDTLSFNPEWVVDKIAPRPILFITTDNDRLVPPEDSKHLYVRAGEPKKLVLLEGYGHYEVYAEPAFSEVMAATLSWYRTYLPAR